MDRFARLVSRLLRVPVAFLSLVEEDRQILPGLYGLPHPRAAARALPPSHALCRSVVDSGRPLVVPDARVDERFGNSPAIADLGIVAYAGMPPADGDGIVLGALCAGAHEPRAWSDGELSDLEDPAAACSAELCLRILSAQSRSVQKVLETARAGADRARSGAQRLEHEAQAGLDHAELLLRASEELAVTAAFPSARAMRERRPVFVPAAPCTSRPRPAT
ncbi:GAF domain-containing protein [Streptomyces sp. NPDC059389]|uniref:GAF domain-containing protein n=1 Tax=Streptomyces sp. NPDC059389 TaxID=3346818 RepID=UPI003688C1B4